MRDLLSGLSAERPVLIAGPTASGKSSLAMEIAQTQGGVIVNADALQVYANWRVLTARPSEQDEAQAPHRLYGHLPGDMPYSVGRWLRDVAPLLGGQRPIIVGGTGLYFTALTQGLAEIPEPPPEVRAEADTIPRDSMLADLDTVTKAKIDTQNRARVQRAWEVQATTGRSIVSWQSETPPPLLPLEKTEPFVLVADPAWLSKRIEQRFDAMIASGALEEARANLSTWSPTDPSSRAIGAAGLIAHVKGDRDLNDAVAEGKQLTRQYAKRQRTWFRSKMEGWRPVHLG